MRSAQLATPLISPLCTRSASLLRVPFSVVPLEEQWRSSWGAIASLTAEEAFGLAKRLGLFLPLQDPFFQAVNWQPSSSPLHLLAGSSGSGSDSAGANGAEQSAGDHPVEAVTFPPDDICSRLCEAFVDRRNPQRLPKAYATLLVFPLLPIVPDASKNGSRKGRRRRRKRLYERVKSLLALSLYVHTVVEMLSDVRLTRP